MHDSLFPAACCLQFSIELGEIETNLQRVEAILAAHPPSPGALVVLPEIWATGFDYPKTNELGQRSPEILVWMQKQAQKGSFFLAGSLTQLTPEASLPYNTLFLVGPEGVLGSVSKQHLFRFWQEDHHYAPGKTAALLPSPYGAVGALVCYDLRFPEVARRQVFGGARLLIVSAQWPLARLDHWKTLLRARAIENQVYIAACNGCGTTGTMEMAGHSMIIGPDGQVLSEADRAPVLIEASLDTSIVSQQRSRFFPAGERTWGHHDHDKIVSLDALAAICKQLKQQGSKVAFTNGCFDILHAGHVDYLEQARAQADCLIIGLNSDTSVRALKGPKRPINNEAQRARVLAALGCVDYVVFFSEETPLRLISVLLPDILVKGADYEEHEIVGAREVKAAGGTVKRIAFKHASSTSETIKKILCSNQP